MLSDLVLLATRNQFEQSQLWGRTQRSMLAFGGVSFRSQDDYGTRTNHYGRNRRRNLVVRAGLGEGPLAIPQHNCRLAVAHRRKERQAAPFRKAPYSLDRQG